MLWLSLLEYFRCNGRDNVIFITDDKGFRNNSDALCREFNNYTGKNIEIQESNFYKTVIGKKEEVEVVAHTLLPDVTLLREKIQNSISALCFGEYAEDYFGTPQWCTTFILRTKATPDDMQIVFNNLRKTIEENIFESVLPADCAFQIDNIENSFPVPFNVLQGALTLYEEININFKDYLPQFFSASANIFNKNFTEPQLVNDDDLPF